MAPCPCESRAPTSARIGCGRSRSAGHCWLGSRVEPRATAHRRGLVAEPGTGAPGELSGRTGGTPTAPRFYLGFESAAANTGTGPLIVLGRRPNIAQEHMDLRQQIMRSDGTNRSVPLRARLRYVRSPDHSHWHVLGFMRYELRSATGSRLMRDRKTGFCLGDRYRVAYAFPGRPPAPQYGERCGKGAPRLLTMREGISIGWGDNYSPHLEGQEFEITSLAARTVRARTPRQLNERLPRKRLRGQRGVDGLRPELASRPKAASPNRRRRALPAHRDLSLGQ